MNLAIWLVSCFFGGIVLFGFCYWFLGACDKI
jgi:hypothetical protein